MTKILNIKKIKTLRLKILRKIRAKICKINKKTISGHRFTDFDDFLINSTLSFLIKSPFKEEDKRCFAMMENVSRYLANNGLKNKNSVMFSIIMPVYNRINTVQAAINSVLNQTYQNFELIIMDDGSDDGTVELLESLKNPKINIIKNGSRQGVSYARNRCLEVAKGKYIAYLDSDNTWEPDFLAAMAGAFIEIPKADALYGGQILYKENNESPFAIRFGSFNRSLLQNRNYIDLNTFCHKMEIYEKIGGFDESLRRYVDWDLILRISDSYEIYSVPILLSNYYYDKAENTITNDKTLVYNLGSLRDKQKERKKTKLKKDSAINFHYNEVSIVIPSYESLKDLKECIESIIDMKKDWLEIIVVDNHSEPEIVEYLSKMEKDGKIKLILNDINYGFSYAVNQGISIAKSENDIIILNNDAIITPGAIETMAKNAYNLPKCGIIIPQQVLPPETKTIKTHVPLAYSDYECDVSLSAHHKNISNIPIFHSGKIVELKFAPFFCAYIKRSLLNQVKGLDAEYGRHYRSDRIFCDYTRHLMKLKIYYVSDAIVYHKLQKSTEHLRNQSNKEDEFNIMFIKNQWETELRKKLGYRKAPWDE
jgi:glycosyltransferase involved in cell wall biosynthesis